MRRFWSRLIAPFCWPARIRELERQLRIEKARASDAIHASCDAINKLSEANKKAAEAKVKLDDEITIRVRNDQRLMALMTDYRSPSLATDHRASILPSLVDRIVRVIDSDIHAVVAYVHNPKCHIEATGRDEPFNSHRVYQMVRLSVNMALSEDCPPEVVASSIAQKVEMAILTEWRNQSILSNPDRYGM